jgi:hypothetical protein
MDTLKTPVIKVEIFTMMAPSLLGRQYRQWPATASLTNRLLAQHNWAGWGGGVGRGAVGILKPIPEQALSKLFISGTLGENL